jgi:hypothetical protein
MNRKSFYTLLVLAMLFSVLSSMDYDMESLDTIFNDDHRNEVIRQSGIAYEEGRIDHSIQLLFEVWKTERTNHAHLTLIAARFSDMNNPEMAGRFLLESAKRSRANDIFVIEGLMNRFENVWSNPSFQTYLDEALTLKKQM